MRTARPPRSRLAAALLPFALAAFGCARLMAELEPPAAVTILESYPRHTDPDAVAFNDLPVSLFYFSQTPPEGTTISKPVRVLFKMVAEGKTCRDAGVGGLKKLQRVALRQKFDAVVNIRATWDGEQLGDATRFGCRRIGDELQLVWEGALATLPPKAAAPAAAPVQDAAAPASVPATDQTGDRLRELQRLYYEGLITREEFLARRQKVLDELSPTAP